VSLEDPAPGLLLGARHLADADTLPLEIVDDLIHAAPTGSPAKVANVLVEETVSGEHNPPAAIVTQPPAQDPDLGPFRPDVQAVHPI
jgi:hypothetical protein